MPYSERDQSPRVEPDTTLSTSDFVSSRSDRRNSPLIDPDFTEPEPYTIDQEKPLARGSFSLHEGLLLNAIHAAYFPKLWPGEDADRMVLDRTDVGPQQGGARIRDLQDGNLRNIVDEYRKNPITALATMRSNLVTLCNAEACQHNFDSPQQLREFLKKRIMRYYDASATLEMRLDAAAFPPSKDPNVPATPGVLPYLPDGYSDMGKESAIDARMRSREKIRIDKGSDLAIARPLLCSILWRATHRTDEHGKQLDPNSTESQTAMVLEVADWIHKNIQYRINASPLGDIGRTIVVRDFVEAREGVCRHHAMQGQLMLQHLGNNSRVFKCYMDGGPHAAQLVEINSKWYLLDITNPQDGKIFLKPLPPPDATRSEPQEDSYTVGGRVYRKNHVAFHRILERNKLN